MKNSLYDRFTPVERAELYDAVLARGDHDEAQLLLQTCPRKTMRVRDPEFVSAVKSAASDLLAPQEITLAGLRRCPQCAAREANRYNGPAFGLVRETPLGKFLGEAFEAILREENKREHLLKAIELAQALADDPELMSDTRPCGTFDGTITRSGGTIMRHG